MNTVYGIILILVALIGLVRVARLNVRARHFREQQEREMVERVLGALDAVKDQDPAFVAEARSLCGYLVPNAWVLHVGKMSAKANLTADSKIAITRAIFPSGAPAGASA